jgi:hypothetical protein
MLPEAVLVRIALLVTVASAVIAAEFVLILKASAVTVASAVIEAVPSTTPLASELNATCENEAMPNKGYPIRKEC